MLLRLCVCVVDVVVVGALPQDTPTSLCASCAVTCLLDGLSYLKSVHQPLLPSVWMIERLYIELDTGPMRHRETSDSHNQHHHHSFSHKKGEESFQIYVMLVGRNEEEEE